MKPIREVQRDAAIEALKAHGWHYGKTAVALGVAQSTLYKWARDWRKAGFLR